MPKGEDQTGYWLKHIQKIVDQIFHPAPKPPPVVIVPPGDAVFPPASLVYYRSNGVSRGPGLPQTETAFTKMFKPMSSSMIAQWRGALATMNPGMNSRDLDRKFGGLTGPSVAFNNGNGSDSNHFKIECGVFCQTTLRVVDGKVYKRAGELWVNVYAFDPTEDYPAPRTLAEIDACRYFFPSIQPSATRVNPFPQFEGHCVVPLWYPGGIMPVRFSRLVAVDRPRSPFQPPRPDLTNGII